VTQPSQDIPARLAEATRRHQAGLFDEAASAYQHILGIDPKHAECVHLLGLAFYQSGRHETGIEKLRQAIAMDPGAARFHANLGTILTEQSQLDEAISVLQRALSLRPNDANAHYNLGVAASAHGSIDLAEHCFRETLRFRHDHAAAANNLANLLRENGRLEEAIAAFQTVVILKPDTPAAHYNLGTALNDAGHMDEAAASFHRTLDLAPDHLDAMGNLGCLLGQRRQLGAAIDMLRRAARIAPEHLHVRTNLAMMLLANGEMAEGWKEYEWRMRAPHMIENRTDFGKPQWYGEPASGKTLFIQPEGGFGDTLQFCRFANLVAARGMRVILGSPRPLTRLLRTLSSNPLVVDRNEDLPDFDFYCSGQSLPLALGTTLETIPGTAPYLFADPARAAAWRARLSKYSKLRVGLVWSGNPGRDAIGKALDRRRSVTPEQLIRLFDIPGVIFFSLQKDDPPPPGRFPMVDVMAEMTDFADTAALIVNLDLVISVDSAAAHLAGALGKPVWLLDRFDSCWRWLANRRDSPWYPSMRIYRQPALGHWDPAISEIACDLRARARG